MSAEVIRVENGRVLLALNRWRLSMRENEELMARLGASMLASVRRTFRHEGYPDHSWVPLAPSTIRSNPKVYTAGHKLLVLSGLLQNSITYRVTSRGAVEIGTSLIYAAVQQFGSRDRSFGIGPRTAEQEAATVDVPAHSRTQRDKRRLGTTEIVDKNGKRRKVRKRIEGPLNAREILVGRHQRHQNIPARPYLVFRAEDVPRMQRITNRYLLERAREAGL
jgi:phage gpG-like protein